MNMPVALPAFWKVAAVVGLVVGKKAGIYALGRVRASHSSHLRHHHEIYKARHCSFTGVRLSKSVQEDIRVQQNVNQRSK